MRAVSFQKSPKRLSVVLLFFLVLTNIYSTAFSSGNTGNNSQISVILNGVKLHFDANPYIKDGRTLVPFRKIFETFGLKVQWSDKDKTILAKDDKKEIGLQINSKTAYVNKASRTLDVSPEIKASRTFVPLRFISESMGADVQWDGSKKAITIKYSNAGSGITDTQNSYANSTRNTDKYNLGETAAYGSLSFSLDKVDFNLNKNSVDITGKISSKDKKLYVYLYETWEKYACTTSFITGSSGNMFNFEAYTVIPSSLKFNKLNYIEVKIMNENEKLVAIAEYKP